MNVRHEQVGGSAPHMGVAIVDQVLDIGAGRAAGQQRAINLVLLAGE